jgi:anti-sigma regulatory factor (Ser/Thr protein kinase)
MRATAHFPRTAEELRAARAFARDTLATWGCQKRMDDVMLLVSELFTNAVLHGAGRVDLRMELVDARLKVEVVDEGRGPPISLGADPGVEATGGRGLLIVDRLAARWGNGHDGDGRTRMWVEVANP